MQQEHWFLDSPALCEEKDVDIDQDIVMIKNETANTNTNRANIQTKCRLPILSTWTNVIKTEQV